jgi:hypothetical protein
MALAADQESLPAKESLQRRLFWLVTKRVISFTDGLFLIILCEI